MWGWLLAAVLSEVVATTSLRASEGFTRLGWSALVVVGYCSAFYALSQALVRGMPLGQAYAVWCALGIAAIAVLGIVLFGESLSPVQVGGLLLVVVGVVMIELGATHP
ncbi:small multidrug resistance pump [Nocardioides zeae]|uniref:Small multidrug resistance pump n=2 Tax=Nocardioides zeae TaxID=1457234 RepID=A0AAJ1TXA9_9ACTN|nr:multidrug efflux SMR transporter [Nocardioides zeae]MDQ1103700.1 small multidrug resistance pump [Nocardioides zeae]MDR6176586.1 small multidrug resistance pump [Nocardioides zeae]MDR6209598.1 small multidrug resistance pump [Nocardioides zeae]